MVDSTLQIRVSLKYMSPPYCVCPNKKAHRPERVGLDVRVGTSGHFGNPSVPVNPPKRGTGGFALLAYASLALSVACTTNVVAFKHNVFVKST